MTDAQVLRAQMVDRIVSGLPLAPAVEDALRRVERHRYVPAAPLADAYQERSVITHAFPDGAPLSCASEPRLVAAMLDALRVEPGQRVLEVGAGTGYNAALLATLAGRDGHVTTVDINPEVTAAARANLHATDFGHVVVRTGDGGLGVPERGPFDRIIVTVGAWDIPSAWWDQLVPGGRLVVPLRWRGTTRAVAFTKREDHWEADWVTLCGFVPMLGQAGERSIVLDLDGLVSLHYDADQAVDADALQGVLLDERSAAWSGITVHGEEPFDRIWLHLSIAEARTVRIAAGQIAVDTGLCTPAIATRSPALVQGGSLAYLTIRQADGGRWELGATGHGPDGQRLADLIIDQVGAWDQDRTADPEISAYPTSVAVPAAADGDTRVIVKPNIRLVLRYPDPGHAAT
jgi:protein-L-isoaspartate(D-aspartate) O-methyltransferase